MKNTTTLLCVHFMCVVQIAQHMCLKRGTARLRYYEEMYNNSSS
jgi:hypothetical protein